MQSKVCAPIETKTKSIYAIGGPKYIIIIYYTSQLLISNKLYTYIDML